MFLGVTAISEKHGPKHKRKRVCGLAVATAGLLKERVALVANC